MTQRPSRALHAQVECLEHRRVLNQDFGADPGLVSGRDDAPVVAVEPMAEPAGVPPAFALPRMAHGHQAAVTIQGFEPGTPEIAVSKAAKLPKAKPAKPRLPSRPKPHPHPKPKPKPHPHPRPLPMPVPQPEPLQPPPPPPMFQLHPPPSGSMRLHFKGIVVDFDFKPVAGAEVDFFANDGLVLQTTANAEGESLVEMTEGSDVTWRVCVRGPGAVLYYQCDEFLVRFQDGAEKDITLHLRIKP